MLADKTSLNASVALIELVGIGRSDSIVFIVRVGADLLVLLPSGGLHGILGGRLGQRPPFATSVEAVKYTNVRDIMMMRNEYASRANNSNSNYES